MCIRDSIRTAISTVINTIIGWLIVSAVFAFVANALGGKTNTGEMLRVFGYTQIFQVLNIIPCLGAIAALVLSIIGAIIGIREAAEFSTGKAVLTGVIGLVILFIVGMVVGLILSPFLG
ncbi:MAG: YIP1 family protein, partial [Anaerolineae bacterium]|nr:YIP1 family protein [Anaerolineae bacterium]